MKHYTDACRIVKIQPKIDSMIEFFLSGPESDWPLVEIESGVYKKKRPQPNRENSNYPIPDYSAPKPRNDYSCSDLDYHADLTYHYNPITSENYYKLASLIKSLDKMSIENILNISSQINPKYASKIRDDQVFLIYDGKVEPSIEFPEPSEVQEKLQDLCDYVNDNPDNMDRVELAGAFAYGFCLIHPFMDGNGRTSRLLSNYFLNDNEIFEYLENDRKDYRNACHSINATGDLNQMYKYFKERLN